jgi:coenzyme F420 biosynthesis associated uncharacterized protein
MSSAVDWKLASKIAKRVAGSNDEFGVSERREMERQFEEFVPLAQRLVEAETGWPSASGPATARVVDRGGWIDANIRSFQRLLRPLLSQMEERLVGPTAWVAPKLAAAEIGAMLGWMSGRVLGQYDLLVLEDADDTGGGSTPDLDGQDTVFFVGPNLFSLEKKFDFKSADFRLWVALHELTHRAQFTGVSFLRPYFLQMVDSLLAESDIDPARFFTALGRIAEAIRTGKNPLADGVTALIASDEQMATMDRLGGMMSLLEGHGDVVMDRAGIGYVNNAERFGSTLRARRQQSGAAKLLTQVIGMEAKMRQYEEGELFIAHIERRLGPAALNLAFGSIEALPTMADIRNPDAWIARVSVGSTR